MVQKAFKDFGGIALMVLTILGSLFLLRGDISGVREDISDLRERITRVETVIDERLPRSPVALQTPSERSTAQPPQ